jgi:phosphate-selective porin OprO and OprP
MPSSRPVAPRPFRRLSRVLVAALMTLSLLPAQAAADQDASPQPGKNDQSGKKAHLKAAAQPHPSIRMGRIFRINFRGRITEVADQTRAPSGDPGDLDIGKRRLGVEGDLFDKMIAFQVSREIGGQKSLAVTELPDTSDNPLEVPTTVTTVSSKFTVDSWRDAWVGYQQFTFARAQYGLFKIPFSVEENTGAEHLDFAYRSLAASTLAPGRDQGWMVHGQIANHALGYEYGVFDHDGHNAHTGTTDPLRVTGGSTTAWRITSEPLRNVDSIWTDLEVGYAETSSALTNGYSSIKGKTVAGFEFYDSKFFVNGERKRTGFELRFRPGPFSLQSEYMHVTEERRQESVYDADLAPLAVTGWYVAGTWALTGEIKSNGLAEPRRPLLEGGVGAIELCARVEAITFGSAGGEQDSADPASHSPRADVVLRNSDRVVTYGVNWYANRWVKVQFNLVREELADPTAGPLPLQPSFWSRVVRFQLAF